MRKQTGLILSLLALAILIHPSTSFGECKRCLAADTNDNKVAAVPAPRVIIQAAAPLKENPNIKYWDLLLKQALKILNYAFNWFS